MVSDYCHVGLANCDPFSRFLCCLASDSADAWIVSDCVQSWHPFFMNSLCFLVIEMLSLNVLSVQISLSLCWILAPILHE